MKPDIVALATDLEITAIVSQRMGRSFRTEQVLADRPGECRVLDLASGSERVAAKAVPMGQGLALYEQLQRLWIATRSCRVLYVPEPYFVDEERDVVVTSFLRGRPGHDRPTVSDSARIGRALAELHALEPDAGARTATMADHISDLIRPLPEALARELPRHAPSIAEAMELLQTTPSPTIVTRVHRDFHLRQLLLTSDRVGVVDWDDTANGDPAFDVGYFLTYLTTHGHHPALSDAFVAGYRGAAGHLVDDTFERRLADSRVFNLLRRAARRFRVRDVGWEAELERMLDELSIAIRSGVAA